MNQRQQPVKQHNTLTPPSTERTGPEGEADEEEPSEVMLRQFTLVFIKLSFLFIYTDYRLFTD